VIKLPDRATRLRTKHRYTSLANDVPDLSPPPEVGECHSQNLERHTVSDRYITKTGGTET